MGTNKESSQKTGKYTCTSRTLTWRSHGRTALSINKKDGDGEERKPHILDPTHVSAINGDKIMFPDETGLAFKNPGYIIRKLQIYMAE